MNDIVVTPEARQSIIDSEHLRLLSIAHYITGALEILFASMFIFHFVIFFVLGNDPNFFPPPKPGQPPFPDQAFRVMGAAIGVFILLGWSFGGLTIFVGRCIKRRSHRALGLIVGCLNLVFLPIGTLLGVATLMVLTRSTVKAAYDA